MGVAARVVVGLVLLVAGTMKARDPEFATTARAFGLPARLAPALPWIEVVLGALLVAQVGGRWTSTVAAFVLSGFTVAVAAQVAGGNPAPCACFGSGASHAPVSTRTLIRNFVLVALAAVGALVQ
jgi:uncharacterized membrane protein YphA (DoxX/SURF4 family)